MKHLLFLTFYSLHLSFAFSSKPCWSAAWFYAASKAKCFLISIKAKELATGLRGNKSGAVGSPITTAKK